MQVNRYLADEAMDRIDHALGRPVNPHVESYRNYFAENINSGEATEMAASPCWHVGKRIGDLLVFHVTAHGRATLASHLLEIGDRSRLFTVSYHGHDMSPVVAKTHSEARYNAWLRWDTTDLPFGEFIRHTRVRLGGGGI